MEKRKQTSFVVYVSKDLTKELQFRALRHIIDEISLLFLVIRVPRACIIRNLSKNSSRRSFVARSFVVFLRQSALGGK